MVALSFNKLMLLKLCKINDVLYNKFTLIIYLKKKKIQRILILLIQSGDKLCLF